MLIGDEPYCCAHNEAGRPDYWVVDEDTIRTVISCHDDNGNKRRKPMRWNQQDIPDQAILTYIGNSPRFLAKVRKLLGRINRAASTAKATPEERSERARNAAKKRWAAAAQGVDK